MINGNETVALRNECGSLFFTGNRREKERYGEFCNINDVVRRGDYCLSIYWENSNS